MKKLIKSDWTAIAVIFIINILNYLWVFYW